MSHGRLCPLGGYDTRWGMIGISGITYTGGPMGLMSYVQQDTADLHK